MRELTLKVYFSDEGTELVEDREGFMAGFGEGFTLRDLLQRNQDGTIVGTATHVDWTIREVEGPDMATASEIDSAAAPLGAFID